MRRTEVDEIKYKLIVIGDENVGKTSIINRFKSNQFTGEYEPTVGLDFQSMSLYIDDQNVTLLLYDTAGQEKYRSLIPLYTKDAHIIFLIYDISNYDSFTNVEKWYDALSNVNKEEAIFFLVGNKVDLVEERKVKEEEGKEFAEQHNFIFQEISALTGDGIQELFMNKLLNQIRTHLLNKDKFNQEQEEENLRLKLQGSSEKILRNQKNKKCCCCPN
jgi:small GTP-binding protein